jgi:hypothetical protein
VQQGSPERLAALTRVVVTKIGGCRGLTTAGGGPRNLAAG